MSEQATKTLITWTEGPFAGFVGKAGDIRMFSVNWRTGAGHPDWNLRTDLPGLPRKIWESNDREELYLKAEKVLAAWLARVSQTTGEA